MKKLEDILKNAKNEKSEIPQSFTRTIENVFDNTQKKSWMPKLATVCCSLVILTGITYAGYMSLYRINHIYDDRGIQTALENKYISNVESNYIDYGDVKIKADYVLMDDLSLDIVFNIISKDILEGYQGAQLTGMEITDENNEQIYIDSENQEIWTKNKGSSYTINNVEINKSNLREVIHLNSTDFPRSKKLFIKFDEITFYLVENGKATTKNYKNDYKIVIDMEEFLKERKTIEIQSKYNNIKDVKLSNTGLVMKIKTDKNLLIEQNRNMKLIDEKGKEYQVADVNLIFNGKEYKDNEYIVFFTLTSYDATNKFTLKIDNTSYEFNK